MSEIHASVIDQRLKIVTSPTIASGGVNEVKVVFTFCEKWEGFGKTAVFYRDTDKVYHAILNENDICVLPWEVYAESGTFYIGVFGEKGDVRRTSTVVKYKVGKGGFITEDTMPNEPTPDVYSQIMNMYQETNALAQEAHQIANEAKQTAKGSVLYTDQTLTDEQKAQVRENVGIKDVLLVYITDNTATHESSKIVAHMASAGTVICICGTNVLAYNGVEQKVADGAWNFFIHFKTATDDEGKWTEYVIDHKGAVTTSIMSNSGGSSVDDSQIGEDAWSSKNTVDKLCPSFTKSGAVVTCEPVEGYPLKVVSHIQAVQTESDATTGEWVESAIYVGPEMDDQGETQEFFTDTLVNGTTYRLTVNATDVAGNQVSLSWPACFIRMEGDDTYAQCATSVSGNCIDFVAKADARAIINLFYKNEIDVLSMYDYVEEVSVYTFKDGVFTLQEYKYTNISTISGHTGVSLHRNSDTFTVNFGQALSSGKNLLPCSYPSGTTNGLTSTVQADGSIVFSGTATGMFSYNLAQRLSLAAGTYTFSVGNQVQTDVTIWVTSSANKMFENFVPSAANNYSKTFTLNNACADLQIYFIVDGNYIRGTVYPQLEAGSVATTYESSSVARTVYGGYFDWNSGVLTVTHSKGEQGVYTLAAPYTIQLTSHEILALAGTNTLYSSTGDTEVTGKTHPLDESSFSYVTPQMFGAIGDGVADDTQAIQKALDSSKSVMLLPGQYRTTAMLEVHKGRTITGSKNSIILPECETVFHLKNENTLDGFAVYVHSENVLTVFEVNDSSVDGNSQVQIRIENMYVMHSTENVPEMYTVCHFHVNAVPKYDGLYDIIVRGCNFDNHPTGGYVARVYSDGDGWISTVVFKNNFTRSFKWHYFFAKDDTTLTNTSNGAHIVRDNVAQCAPNTNGFIFIKNSDTAYFSGNVTWDWGSETSGSINCPSRPIVIGANFSGNIERRIQINTFCGMGSVITYDGENFQNPEHGRQDIALALNGEYNVQLIPKYVAIAASKCIRLFNHPRSLNSAARVRFYLCDPYGITYISIVPSKKKVFVSGPVPSGYKFAGSADGRRLYMYRTDGYNIGSNTGIMSLPVANNTTTFTTIGNANAMNTEFTADCWRNMDNCVMDELPEEVEAYTVELAQTALAYDANRVPYSLTVVQDENGNNTLSIARAYEQKKET